MVSRSLFALSLMLGATACDGLPEAAPLRIDAGKPDTTQSLCGDTATNALNCGVCDHGCLGGMCSGGTCQPILLAEGPWFPNLIVVKDGFLYWTATKGAASVMRMPTSGGAPEDIALGSPGWGLAVDSTNVYYTSGADGGAVQTTPRGGGVPKTLTFDIKQPMELALQGNALYWTQRGDNSFISDASLMTMPIGGGTPVKLLGSPCCRSLTGLAVDPTGAYVTWFGSVGDSTLSRVSLDGGAETVFAGTQDNPQPLIADRSVLFWGEVGTKFDHGVLHSAWTDGTHVETMLSSKDPIIRITADEYNVYWTWWPGHAQGANGFNGGVRGLSRNGGSKARELAIDQTTPWGIAVDDVAIYWTTWGVTNATNQKGAIMKLAKP